MQDDLVLSVSDFVAVLNQTLEFAYPSVVVQGELANLRVSKNKWVYFDLKDENSSVKFFGTVFQLPGPLEDGLMLQVRGLPRLHPLYGFSVNVQFMQPVGEGSLRRAAALLEAKLAAEGLFDEDRKRPLPFPPKKVGLITSGESAAYHDFIKILNERWTGIEVLLADVQVQGEPAAGQIVGALNHFNTVEDVDVVVLTRGGGSAEDLAAFSTEGVTRAVAASRTPTLVAIGHEVDFSLAELAADKRASTPSNAAQMLTPDKRQVAENLKQIRNSLQHMLSESLRGKQRIVSQQVIDLQGTIERRLMAEHQSLQLKRQVLAALSPEAALRRGYAIIRSHGESIRSVKQLKPKDKLNIRLGDGEINAEVIE